MPHTWTKAALIQLFNRLTSLTHSRHGHVRISVSGHVVDIVPRARKPGLTDHIQLAVSYRSLSEVKRASCNSCVEPSPAKTFHFCIPRYTVTRRCLAGPRQTRERELMAFSAMKRSISRNSAAAMIADRTAYDARYTYRVQAVLSGIAVVAVSIYLFTVSGQFFCRLWQQKCLKK